MSSGGYIKAIECFVMIHRTIAESEPPVLLNASVPVPS